MSKPTLSDPLDHSLPGSSVRGIFQARVLEWVAIAFSKITGVCSHFLLQGIFPIQSSNLGLLHYRQILYLLSHHGVELTKYQYSRFSCVNTNKLFNPFQFQFLYKTEMIIAGLANVVKLNKIIHVKGLLLAQCLKLGSVLNGYPFHHHTPHHYPYQLVCRIINS